MSERGQFWLIVAAASVIAIGSAFPYASGWNDGSRLASVESLVDRHTWVIDGSLFLEPLPDGSPYHPGDARGRSGTLDKLWIGGRWYSDKSPVPALWLALCYWLMQTIFGLVAIEHPAIFCYAMAFCFSGAAYVIAVTSIFRMTTLIGLPGRIRLLVTASFALATLALIYVRTVNNHLPFLAATSLMMVQITHIARGDKRLARWAALGLLASIGYALDLGAGPPFVLALAGMAALRRGGLARLSIFLAAALPIFLLHHVLNYRIGGTLTPANAHAPYVQWPGSPFAAMTGQWHHANSAAFGLYALELLFGKAGFVIHNLPLLLGLPGFFILARKRPAEWPIIVGLLAGCAGVWIVYAVSSRNLSGVGCSIRWFLPTIAPGYFLLAVLVRERPAAIFDLALLSIAGAVLMSVGWAQTIWWGKMIPGFWFILAATLIAWVWSRPQSRLSLHKRTFASAGQTAARMARYLPKATAVDATTLDATTHAAIGYGKEEVVSHPIPEADDDRERRPEVLVDLDERHARHVSRRLE
jgi:hypothetical protein